MPPQLSGIEDRPKQKQLGATGLSAVSARLPKRPVVYAIGLGLVVFIGFTNAGRDTRVARPVAAQLEDLAELSGLGIRQVSLKGHRFTLDGDIFDALALDKYRTMLSFSILDARARLEALPWVLKASVSRELPDSLSIEISERAAFAIWRRGDDYHLIDKTGRVLAAIRPDAMASLPLVIGDGAASEAHKIMQLVAQYPRIARRLVATQKIGNRRWTLWLASVAPGGAGETAIHLPPGDVQQALERVIRLDDENNILGRALAAIDLRDDRQVKLMPARYRNRERNQARARTRLKETRG